MEFNTFVRRPFTVEAVQVTTENIEELAPLIGQLRHKENGVPYIQVDKRLVPNVFRVFPGFWMTRMDDNIRCYSKRVFNEQFQELTVEAREHIDALRGSKIQKDVKVGPFGRPIREEAVG